MHAVPDNNFRHFFAAVFGAEEVGHAQGLRRSAAAMSKHMEASLRALCFFYRNPPAGSGVRPQPYKKIVKLIRRPHMSTRTIKTVVHRFLAARKVRGRKEGWRKTTPAESLQAQGVNGEDLLNIRDDKEFCRDLKVTPFVARKVLSLRDQRAS